MGLAEKIAVFTIAVSSLTFIAFFGRLPALRNTPIGWIHRLLVIRIPAALRRLDVYLTNGRTTGSLMRFGDYLMHDKHPLVIVFFLGLIAASAMLFLPQVWPDLSHPHQAVIPILLPLPYLFTYLSARSNPTTYITKANHAAQMRCFPYDRILYYPGLGCRTCQFLKPPRSKHCSICKTCVARMDHHCIWVNNCLGRGNYKYFLYLLLSTSALLAYGAYLAYVVLSPRVHAHYAKYEQHFAYDDGGDPTGTWFEAFDKKLHYFLIYASIYLDAGGLRAAGVGLLALLTWPLPLGLLGYHVYLIWAGMTTNESAKWADWRDDMSDGLVFLGRRHPDTFHDPPPANSQQGKRQHRPPPPDEEPPTAWPLESRHILVRTKDGKPPQTFPLRISEVMEAGSFERVWGLQSVENVYDLGFWDNLVEALLR